MIDEILISTEKGIVTRQDLQRTCDEYIETLPDPDSIQKNVQVFSGMIRMIGNRLIKPILPDTRPHNYALYDEIWNKVYLYLCSIYGYIPNILLFCNGIIFINPNNIYGIGIDNNNINYSGQRVNKDRLEIIKKWRADCESALSSQVQQHSSIGSLFMLKAKFGYREEQTVTIQTAPEAARLTVDELEQIAQQEQPPEEPEIDNI